MTGQITEADLDRIKELGFGSILCARPDHEESGQPTVEAIRVAAARRGIDVIHVPVSGPPSPDAVAAFNKHWQDMAKPVLGYCRSGARAGLLWTLLESAE